MICSTSRPAPWRYPPSWASQNGARSVVGMIETLIFDFSRPPPFDEAFELSEPSALQPLTAVTAATVRASPSAARRVRTRPLLLAFPSKACSLKKVTVREPNPVGVRDSFSEESRGHCREGDSSLTT